MTPRRLVFGALASLIPGVAYATNKPKPKCECDCKDGKDGPPGPRGPQGPPGPKGEDGICKPCEPVIVPRVNMHWDGEYFIPSVGVFLPALTPTDITGTVPGAHFNDEFWYLKKYDTLVYFDNNWPTGIPHVLVMKRGAESQVQRPDGLGPWDRITGIGPRLLSYVGNNAGRAHHCVVSLDTTETFARSKGWIYLDWTPITVFTTFGTFPVL